MRNETLIEALADALTPVRRALTPGQATLCWVMVAVPVLALAIGVMGPRPDLAALMLRPDFAVDEALAGLTAVVSAYAAFCAGRPDQPGWKLGLPVVVVLVWLLVLGRQCAVLSMSVQGAALRLHADWMCVPAIAITGLVPAIMMVVLLRRSPLFRTTHACLCGTMAAAAAAEVALRLFHGAGSFATLLVWQMGSVALFTMAGSAMGRLVVVRFRPRLASAGMLE